MKHCIYLDYDYKTNYQEKLNLIKKYNFDAVFLFHRKEIEEAFLEIRKTDLIVEAIHLSFKYCNELWIEGELGDLYVERSIKGILDAKKHQVKTVIFHITSSATPPEITEIGIQRFKHILKICEENEINLACENLRRLDYLDYLFENCKSDYLKFCFDSGHANAFTKNIDEFPWEKYKDKLICLHLHDNNGLQDLHQIPFDGNIDWKLLMQNLKKINFQGFLASEAVFYRKNDLTEEDFVRKVKHSLNRLDKFIEE